MIAQLPGVNQEVCVGSRNVTLLLPGVTVATFAAWKFPVFELSAVPNPPPQKPFIFAPYPTTRSFLMPRSGLSGFMQLLPDGISSSMSPLFDCCHCLAHVLKAANA